MFVFCKYHHMIPDVDIIMLIRLFLLLLLSGRNSIASDISIYGDTTTEGLLGMNVNFTWTIRSMPYAAFGIYMNNIKLRSNRLLNLFGKYDATNAAFLPMPAQINNVLMVQRMSAVYHYVGISDGIEIGEVILTISPLHLNDSGIYGILYLTDVNEQAFYINHKSIYHETLLTVITSSNDTMNGSNSEDLIRSRNMIINVLAATIGALSLLLLVFSIMLLKLRAVWKMKFRSTEQVNVNNTDHLTKCKERIGNNNKMKDLGKPRTHVDDSHIYTGIQENGMNRYESLHTINSTIKISSHDTQPYEVEIQSTEAELPD